MKLTPQRMAWALAISVGLNLFLGGFLVARAALRPPHPHGFGPHPMAGPFAMLHDLRDLHDPKLGERAEALFEERRERFEDGRRKLGDARHKVARAMKRQPPDRAELEAAFAELRNVTTSSQAEIHAGLIELVQTLTPEQRERLIRKWTKGPRHGHHGSELP